MIKNLMKILGTVILAGSNIVFASPLADSIRICMRNTGTYTEVRTTYVQHMMQYNCSGEHTSVGGGWDRERISYQLAREIDQVIHPGQSTIVNNHSNYDVTYERQDLGISAHCFAEDGDEYSSPIHFCYVRISPEIAFQTLLDRI